jgi:hypothetical protein
MSNIRHILIFFLSFCFSNPSLSQEIEKKSDTLFFIVEKIDSNIIKSFSNKGIKHIEIVCQESINEIPKEVFEMWWINSLYVRCVSNYDKTEKLNDTIKIIFNNLKELETLTLIGVPLVKIDDKISLSKLKNLKISYTKLNTIPIQFLNSNLESLTIERSPVTTIPKYIKNANKLKILRLYGLSISELPKEVFYLKQLTELAFDGTDIAIIPDDIVKLKNLERLSAMTITGIEKCSSLICDLPKLKYFTCAFEKDGIRPACFDDAGKWRCSGTDCEKIK